MSPAALNWIKAYKVLFSLNKIFLALKNLLSNAEIGCILARL